MLFLLMVLLFLVLGCGLIAFEGVVLYGLNITLVHFFTKFPAFSYVQCVVIAMALMIVGGFFKSSK